jgi:aspartate/methionine/tyrosine aminotransferase
MGYPIASLIEKVHFPPISEVTAWVAARQAAKRPVDEAAILSLPGEVFGPCLEGYPRLAFGNIREETIPEAVRRFQEMER